MALLGIIFRIRIILKINKLRQF